MNITEFYQQDSLGLKFEFAPLLTRSPILNYLTSQPGPFSVIDIGGGADLWSHEVVTLVVDMIEKSEIKKVINHIPTPVDSSSFDFIQCDITRESGWQKIIDYTAIHGIFDFAICSHVLEDIPLPEIVLEFLPKVARMGFISSPSANKELSKNSLGLPFKGYDHHRYFFTPGYERFEDGELVILPKYTMIEHILFDIDHSVVKEELQCFWKGSIPFSSIFDYLKGSRLDGKPLWQVYSSLNF